MTTTSESMDLGIATDWDPFTSVEQDGSEWISECGACSWSAEFVSEDAARAAIEEHWSQDCPSE